MIFGPRLKPGGIGKCLVGGEFLVNRAYRHYWGFVKQVEEESEDEDEDLEDEEDLSAGGQILECQGGVGGEFQPPGGQLYVSPYIFLSKTW